MFGSVLVLEDEAVVAMEIEACLADAGHRVVGVASSAREATALARKGRADLLLADISIAGPVDGIETARIVREICGADVVFLTAHRSREMRDRATDVGPLGYLVKPFLECDLATAVEIALCRRASRCRATDPRLPFEVAPETSLRILSSGVDACPMASHCVGAE